MLYSPDTHALVWYLTADKRLGPNAYSALSSVEQGSDQAIVSVLVLTEIAYLEEKGRIRISLEKLVEQLLRNNNYQIVPFTLEILGVAKTLVRIPELFDRIIAATALQREAVLLSRDAVFENSAVKTAW